MKIFVMSVVFVLVCSNLFSQDVKDDPLEAEVQALKRQQKEKEEQEALKRQQKEKEEQEALTLQILKKQEAAKKEAYKALEKRMENSAFLSKEASEKLSYKVWNGKAHKTDEYHQPVENNLVVGLKAKLVRVYFHRSPQDGSVILLDGSLELLGEDGTLYSMLHFECSEEEAVYVRAFVKLWKKEQYTRVWADATGQFKVEASFEGLSNGMVKLQKGDKVFSVSLQKLSSEDQKWVKAKVGAYVYKCVEVESALTWLAKHQDYATGKWSLKTYVAQCKPGDRSCTGTSDIPADAGATALALLPFLSAGYTHQSNNIYKQHIRRGIAWLIRNQQPDGNLARGAQQPMYSHGIATAALSAAYGLTKDREISHAAQGAVNYILKAQNATDGGWRYNPGDAGDTSVMGWQLLALKTAQNAGLNVNELAFSGASKWLDSVALHDGTEYSYQPQQPPVNTMNAVGLFGRQCIGITSDNPMLVGGVKYLMHNLPDQGMSNIYYWYYATKVMHNRSGREWDTWNRKMRDLLVHSQVRDVDECARGSWAPEKDLWGQRGGRVMQTSLSCLILEMGFGYNNVSEPASKIDVEDPVEPVSEQEGDVVPAPARNFGPPTRSAGTKESHDQVGSEELEEKRKEHTNWINTRAIGMRQVQKDSPTTVGGTNPNGTPYFGTVHNYYWAIEKYTYSQPFQGTLVSYVGNDVVIDVGNERISIKYQFLGKDDCLFLNEYRRMEKELRVNAQGADEKSKRPATKKVQGDKGDANDAR